MLREGGLLLLAQKPPVLVVHSDAITAAPYYLRFISGMQAALAESKRHLMFATFGDGFPGAARDITLENFDGRQGLTLKLPADQQTRIFVLKNEK